MFAGERRSQAMGVRVVILGAGPGGYVAAIRAAQLGAQVTLIERDRVGGTCLNWGCIPTKTLKATTDLLDALRRARELGLALTDPVRPDVSRIMTRKREVMEIQATGILKLLNSHKVHYLQGRGEVMAPDRLLVRTPKGDAELAADRLILATGSSPLALSAFPFDGERILSSDHALNLAEIPGSVLIVGGGVVGCEFADILANLGTQVSVVEALPRLLPLPAIDQDSSLVLLREMKKRRITVHLNRTVERADLVEGRVRAFIVPSPSAEGLKEREKSPLTKEVDKLLVCVGRRPNTREMGLERLGLEMDPRGWIVANARMETNVPGVYAIGDVLGPTKVMLAHVASAEGLVAAENAMGVDSVMRYDLVPSAVFTTPEVASVGLTEAQAQEGGLNGRADVFLFRALGKAQALGEIAGHVKLVSERHTRRLLGAHMIGAHVTDLIAEATLALRMGATVEDLASTIHAHPTLSEAFMEVAHKALDAPIHSPKGS
jgi:dihydrolipoamide dehydrogenase